MRFGNLVFGVALLLVASTLALTITFRNSPREKEVATTGQSTSSNSNATAPRTPDKSSALPSTPSSPRKSLSTPSGRKGSDVENLDLVLDDSPSAPKLSPAERQVISQRTAGVKKAALAKLEKMTERFDLTSEQRRKIFPLLVQSTDGYHPAMVLAIRGGNRLIPVELAKTGQTPDEAIHDALDPEQQDEFVEAQLDERAWWNEIVTQLEEDFDSAVAAGTAPPAETDLDPDKAGPVTNPANPAPQPGPAPQQGDNIFDLIK